jgi:hypothetical protein
MIASGGVLVSSAEWLVTGRHLHDEGLLGWTVAQLRHRSLADGPLARIVNPFFRHPAVLWLFGLQLVAATDPALRFQALPRPGCTDRARPVDSSTGVHGSALHWRGR